MNFPSLEFDDTVASLCHGTATEADAADLQTILQSGGAALDEYLWQVELHTMLASRGMGPAVDEEILDDSLPRRADARPRPERRRALTWAAAAAVLLFLGGSAWWAIQNLREVEPKEMASTPSAPSPTGNISTEGETATGGASVMGIYRQNVAFVAASAAPVIVGTGRLEPIELGALVPYAQDGSTLHVWDWSQSTKSRVFKDTRLWPHERFALSPDGKRLVWASGVVFDLTSGEKTTLDLGGEYFFDNAGGKLERIQGLQFTPDGRRLALLLSNLVVTKSDHPLRRQDFTTAHSVQIVEFPAASLVCEFEATFPLAFTQDGKRVAYATPEAKFVQQVIERNAETGEVVRQYDPHIREHAYALAYSPDGHRLAVFDGVGEVLAWETATGDLAYRVDVRQATQSSATLRHSPDGKHLAIGVFQKLYVVNAETGAVEATAATTSPNEIHWAADSKTLHVLTYVSSRGLAEGADANGQPTLCNMYPKVEKFDFEALRARE